MKKLILVVAVLAVALVLPAASATASAGPQAQVAKKKCNKKKKYKKHRKHKCKKPQATPVTTPVTTVVTQENTVTSGPTKATLGSADFTTLNEDPLFRHNPSNGTVSQTPDGIEFGPYADGSAAGGSVEFSGLNGQPLSAVQSLVYVMRYTADNDTGGVGVPYLRIFLEDDTHDAIFSPNTQPPNPDIAQGPFHTWAATSGVWRYDDDGGSGGPYGVNGAPYSTLQADHGTETISGIYISVGNSAGINLAALLREWMINETNYSFGS